VFPVFLLFPEPCDWTPYKYATRVCESMMCESMMCESMLCKSMLCEIMLCASLLCESRQCESMLCGQCACWDTSHVCLMGVGVPKSRLPRSLSPPPSSSRPPSALQDASYLLWAIPAAVCAGLLLLAGIFLEGLKIQMERSLRWV